MDRLCVVMFDFFAYYEDYPPTERISRDDLVLVERGWYVWETADFTKVNSQAVVYIVSLVQGWVFISCFHLQLAVTRKGLQADHCSPFHPGPLQSHGRTPLICPLGRAPVHTP